MTTTNKVTSLRRSFRVFGVNQLEDDLPQSSTDHNDYRNLTLHRAAREGKAALILGTVVVDAFSISNLLSSDFLNKRASGVKARLELINSHDGQRMTPLHYAAKYGRIEAVRVLLANGANPLKVGDVDECLPLHFAVRYRPSAIRAASSSAPSTPMMNRMKFADDGSQRMTSDMMSMSVSDDGFIDTLHLLIDKTIETSLDKTESKSTMLHHHDDDINLIDVRDKYGDTALHYAVSRTNHRAVKLLLERQSNANAQNKQKITPLHLAAKNGDLAMLELLLTHGANLSCRDDDGNSPLHIAAKEGHIRNNEFLEQCFTVLDQCRVEFNGKKGEEAIVAAITETDRKGANLLHCAVESGNERLVSRIVNEDSKIDCIQLVNTKKENGFTALHLASEFGHYNIVKCLIRHQADVDLESNANETPLLLAAKNNHYRIAGYLAQCCPAAISNINDSGESPLLIAARNGHVEVTDVLLSAGANINDTDEAERSMVFIAAMEGNAAYLNALLQRADIASLVDSCDQYQNTPIHAASKNGHKRALLSLVRAGANVMSKNVEEETALHKAAKFGQDEIIQELHELNGKLIYDVDSNRDTALHLAAKGGYYKTVQLLIQLDADVDALNVKNWTALDCAAACGAEDICELLLGQDYSLIKENQKITPLHLACMGGHANTVRMLLENNQDCTQLDVEGRNCLDYAIDFYHEECVELLLNSSSWQALLSNAQYDKNTERFVTPMRKLIQHLPEQASVIFNRCITVSSDDGIEYELDEAPRQLFESKHIEVNFNYSFMDDEYIMDDWRSDIAISQPNMPYDLNKQRLGANHPLTWLIDHNRQELIAHPLVLSLYNIKWNKLGWYIYYGNLTIYLIFMLLLNHYALRTPPPFAYDLSRYNGKIDPLNHPCGPNQTGMIPILPPAQEIWKGPEGCYQVEASRTNIIWVIIATAGLRMFVECWQMYYAGIEYFLDITNYLEWFLYIFAIMFVIDIEDSTGPVSPASKRTDWQWQVGSVAVWLSWTVLLMFLQKLPKVGVFILMFNTIMRTFLRFVIVFTMFMLSFSMPFFMLLSNTVPFDSVGKSFVKSLIMMIGEFEYEVIFEFYPEDLCHDDEEIGVDCHTEDWNTVNYYHYTVYVMFVIFVAVMTIIVNNLLTGLAVDDVGGVQETAMLRRQALKIQLALESIYLVPNSLRYRWYRDQNSQELTLDKTKLPLWTRFTTWLDPDSAITQEKMLLLQKAQRDTESDEIQDSIGELNQDVSGLKTRLRQMDQKLSRIEVLLESLAKSEKPKSIQKF